MTMLEALESAQFVVNHQGQRTGVLLTLESWEMLVQLVEDAADAKTAANALSELNDGRPETAGWLAWDDVKDAW